MERIAISIIMPIYNVEKYLKESIYSAMNQTLKNIEIICVDDGSTDSSGYMIDEYSKIDNRIKVIHKKNTGYGNTMNVGLQVATGKYIAILEPDDFISSNMLSNLYEIAERENIDFIKSNFAFLEGKQGSYEIYPTRIYDDLSIYGKILTESEKKILFKGYIAHWTSIYRKDFLEKNKIKFNETPGASYQDTGFWFQTLAYAEKVYLYDDYYYHYRLDNPNSSMNNRKKVFCICHEYDFILEQLKKNKNILNNYLPEYINCRYVGYRDTIDRIADEYKQEFIIRMSKDFCELKNQNLFSTSAMNDEDKENLICIMNNSMKFYRKKSDYAITLHKQINIYNSLYIYGAGNIGNRVFKSLLNEDKEKVKGFLVTQKQENSQKCNGLPIYEFKEIRSFGEQVGIIIGVSKRYEEEIVQYLKSQKVKNIVFLPS